MDKQYVQLAENQQIAYRTYGNGTKPLLLFHGLVGGSWLGGEWITAIEASDVCCIVPERPGYGTSSPIELKSVAEWMPIVRKLVEVWNLPSLDVIGCSAGAPYAYATAAALTGVVSRVWISSGVPAVYEDSVLRHYKEEDRQAYRSYAVLPQKEIQSQYEAQMEAFAKRVKDSDITYLENTLKEILAQHCFGMAQESRLQILPWEIDFFEIEQPVTIFHAAADEIVPYAAAREMTKFIKHCSFKDVATSKLPPGESVHIRSNSESFFAVLRQYAK